MGQDSFIHEASEGNINTPQGENLTVFRKVEIARNPVDATAPYQVKHPDGYVEPISVSSQPGYGVYRAVLTQEGVNAPVVSVLENTLSAPVVWTRLATGVYVGTLVSEFQQNKTHVLYQYLNSGTIEEPRHIVFRASDDTIFWVSQTRPVIPDGTGFVNADDLILEQSIEIKVYP